MAQLRAELDGMKDARKADAAKAKQQFDRKMERAQAEIDELSEQLNAA